VDKSEFITPTHKVDCYKNRVALEVEWNNKDPFFDRDLNNFRLLFELRAIDAGLIITRCTELQRIFNQLGRGPSFGNSTTHMAKLLPRLDGESGGGCPVVVFGIRGAAWARARAGLTQAQVARRMKTTQTAIARLEGGRVKPSTRTLERYAKATGHRLVIGFEPKRGKTRPKTVTVGRS
jgi:DNA-binding XRE family transcriptional regulator